VEVPEGAEEPTEPPIEEVQEDEPDCQLGSIIECQNQTLGESLGIPGAPFSLNYRSSRAEGRKSAYSIDVPLTGSAVPTELRRIEFRIAVAGRLFSGIVETPVPDLTTRFTWDGMDVFGRVLQGAQRAT